MDGAEVCECPHPTPERCSGEPARRPAGQVQANLGGARTHPRAGAQGRVLAAQGVRPQKASAASGAWQQRLVTTARCAGGAAQEQGGGTREERRATVLCSQAQGRQAG